MVFVMCSNHEEVIGKIANFAESDQTSMAIQGLADVVKQKEVGDFMTRLGAESVNARRDALLYSAMTNSLQNVSDYSTTSDAALVEINSLINLLDALKQQ
jgi:hypothetical protein